ncbi:MAG: PD40 domain-containing protein, partial [Candidatus Eremiobacteraeota bacterium]|nr:PD40 domain-containing protein [Candidatus Eremiobacteraeota bacterium]
MLWPTISRDGTTIAFEHAMGIWTCDTATGAVRRIPIVLRGLPDVTPPQHLSLTSRFTGLDLAPDGRKVAFVARGRIFAANARDGGEAVEVMRHSPSAFNEPVWARNSRQIAFTVDRGLDQSIATFAFPDGPEQVLTPAGHHDASPIWSPDGRRVAFVRDERELHLLDPASRADRLLARGRFPFGINVAFSPAGDWLAYRDTSSSGFSNVWVVPTAGGTPRQLTFLPNAFGGSIVWSRDGSRLFFVSSQRTELAQVAQVDLVPRTPRFREDTFRRLFTQEPPAPLELPPQTPASPLPSTSPGPVVSASPSAAPRPRTVTIDFTGIRDRISLLPIGLDVQEMTITPDSRTLVVAARAANQDNLYTFSVDETAAEPPVARQITTTPGRKSNLSLTPDGKSVYFLDAGRVAVATLDGRPARTLAVTAAIDVDFARDKPLVFR